MQTKAREATIKLLMKILITVVIFDLMILIFTVLEEYVLDLDTLGVPFISYSAMFHIVVILVQLFMIINIFTKWYITYYHVGDTHISKRTGLLVKRDKVINFGNIRIVNYKQGIIGRMFNYGDIVFELVGGEQDFVMKAIESPLEIVNKVKNTITPGA